MTPGDSEQIRAPAATAFLAASEPLLLLLPIFLLPMVVDYSRPYQVGPQTMGISDLCEIERF